MYVCYPQGPFHLIYEFKRVVRLCMGNKIPSIMKRKKRLI